MSAAPPPVWPRWTRAAAGLAVLGLLALLLLRIHSAPVDRYGDSAAGWIEHQARLRALHAAAEATGPLDLLKRADGLYPPGLHLLSAPLLWLAGPDPRAAGLIGPAALLVLAWGVGRWAEGLRRGAGLPAALIAALTPALHGMSARYAYDLPMAAALWATVGWAAGPRPRPLTSAITTLCAALLKWSALPLGLPLLLGAAAGRRRGTALFASALCVAAPVLGSLAGLASLEAMSSTTFQPPTGAKVLEAIAALPVVGPALAAMAAQAAALDAARLGFYPSRLWWSCYGPAGALGLLPLVAMGLRARATRAPILVGTALSALFLLLLLPPLDERFLVAWLGLPAATAGVGLTGLSARARGPALTCVAVVGLALAADLHAPGRWAPTLDPAELSLAAQGRGPGVGLGPASAVDRRGWARTADRLPPRDALGDALRAVLRTAGAQRGRPVLSRDRLRLPEGEQNWWGAWQAAAAHAGEALQIELLPPGPLPPPRRGALLLLPAADAPWAEPGDAAPPAGWRPCAPAQIDDPEGGPGLRCFEG
ncbi:MAG: hypothetical protein JNM72_22655 [Deltaproteobacteria bacterium]|nr:hypothetical protein [Deltaproteobacteria bacterium]